MGKKPQNSFRRLIMVGSNYRKPRRQAAAARWWGPKHTRDINLNQTTQAAPVSMRMVFMPAPSRYRAALAAIAKIWRFLLAMLAAGELERPCAAVLPFRRPERGATPVRRFRHVPLEERVASAKPSGSVRWDSYRAAARQEGGKG
jgi:hypothetical protein